MSKVTLTIGDVGSTSVHHSVVEAKHWYVSYLDECEKIGNYPRTGYIDGNSKEYLAEFKETKSGRFIPRWVEM